MPRLLNHVKTFSFYYLLVLSLSPLIKGDWMYKNVILILILILICLEDISIKFDAFRFSIFWKIEISILFKPVYFALLQWLAAILHPDIVVDGRISLGDLKDHRVDFVRWRCFTHLAQTRIDVVLFVHMSAIRQN